MTTQTNASLPLARFKVLDLTRVRAGPTAVRQLADWGADVIKIEAPSTSAEGQQSMGGPRHGFDFQNLHRNKRSLTLNLKSDEGKRLFKELISESDVLVENFSPGALDRLGLGYDVLKEINPGLIYTTIKGFGTYGPYADFKSFEPIAQAMGGAMSDRLCGWAADLRVAVDRRFRHRYACGDRCPGGFAAAPHDGLGPRG